MNEPKVSVCVVTYNHACYVRDCLMSVLTQCQDVSLEILVGDDLSEDKTGFIVQSLADQYPNLIHYFRHSQRKGPIGNYHFLIRQARGQYIAHLDGDDFWLPGKLRRQFLVLEQNPNLSAVVSNAIVVDDNVILKGSFNKLIPEFFDLGFLLRRGNFICHSSLVYRSKLKESILNIPTPCIDYQIHIQLAQQGSLGYISSVLVGYRVASATSMSLLQTDYVRELYWQALMSVEKSPEICKELGSAMSHFLFTSIWQSISKKKRLSEILLWYKKVLQNLPISKPYFALLFCWFFLKHLEFKATNFVTRVLLRRPLKAYFPR